MKPVETGCAEKDGQPFPQDAFYLKEASGCEEPLEKICPYRLRAPLAPSVAAAREKTKIDVSVLTEIYNEISSARDITLIEGAGGLLVPLLPGYTYADLARLLKLPLLVVAANRLGAINHLLLTLEHSTCRGLRVFGYVLNQVENPPSLAAETNTEALFSLTSIPYLGGIPYLSITQSNGLPLETNQVFLATLFEERINLAFLETALCKLSAVSQQLSTKD
jgi:dethiobiotin synthetase